MDRRLLRCALVIADIAMPGPRGIPGPAAPASFPWINSKTFRRKNSIFPPFRVKLAGRYPKRPAKFDDEKERSVMSSKNSNKLNVPEARAAMDKFKMEAASDLAVSVPS